MESYKYPKISRFMNNVLDQYKLIRGKSKDGGPMPFWDVIVITASDDAQKMAYELQIEEKKTRGELPTDLPIFVVADPPGVRIGNGGSTLVSLEFLEKEYGSKLFKLKILLIHAGGWSQRLPSASVLGKVFSILPHGDTPFQMLDLKLALYWPFVEKIQPGVFLVCADDFVVFDLGIDKDWMCPGEGFTALAHPAPLEFGTHHGVYVLSDVENIDTSKPVDLCECLKVLQKPSESRMKIEGAPLRGNSFSFGDGIKLEGDIVYTDSCFYFGTDIMRKLLRFKEAVGDLSCEIDAYGDFLQAVGKNATSDYIKLTFNVSQPTSNLLNMRQQVFDALNGSDIHVLILNSSKFMHVGTTHEVLLHFCHDIAFQQLFGIRKNVFTSWGDSPSDSCSELSPDSCVVHSALVKDSVVKSNCFLEFCHFDVAVTISKGCIISNCCVLFQESRQGSLSIPQDTFIHTVPIQSENGKVEYVTIFFQVDDNLKKSTICDTVSSLPFLGSNVGLFLTQEGIESSDILPFVTKSATSSGKEAVVQEKVSLWNLKLYTAKQSMTSSMKDALRILNSSDGCPHKKQKSECKRFSMAELLKVKDVATMLKYRRDLYKKIMERK